MSLAIIGAALLVFCTIAYAWSIGVMSDEDLHAPVPFQKRKDLYRKRRDEFRNDPEAMAELKEWKALNDDVDYKKLGSGLIPASRVGETVGSKPFRKCDTWFSEFEAHNKRSLILSESPQSYIIGNLASYDKRQYPQWFNPKFKPGVNTPEGQAFGHTLIVSRKRVFNVVDPDATENDSALLKEMKEHFVRFWEDNGSPKLLKRVKSAFDEQNAKLASNDKTLNSYHELLPTIKADFETLSHGFRHLKPEDFEYGFHAHPDNSVGHLHMHVYPKKSFLRKFSTYSHDWKTIPLDAILEVEEEDKIKQEQASG